MAAENRSGVYRGLRGLALWCAALVATGCAGAHPYSYGRSYEPLSDEAPLMERALDVSYEAVRRNPEGYKDGLLGWFGTVVAVGPGPSQGVATLAVDLRFHQERHLCTDKSEASCRVTISSKIGGPFSVNVALSPVHRSGPLRVGPGSLVKVYGHARPGAFDERGGPVLDAVYYRHFPTGTYVIVDGDAPERFRR